MQPKNPFQLLNIKIICAKITRFKVKWVSINRKKKGNKYRFNTISYNRYSLIYLPNEKNNTFF